MEPKTQAALEDLCLAQRRYESADKARDQAVRAARDAGASWELIAYATRTALSTAHSRWSPRRVKAYGLPRPVELRRRGGRLVPVERAS